MGDYQIDSPGPLREGLPIRLLQRVEALAGAALERRHAERSIGLDRLLQHGARAFAVPGRGSVAEHLGEPITNLWLGMPIGC